MRPSLKILMIVPEPLFTPRGTPFSIRGRLEALTGLGHQVDVVTYHVGQETNWQIKTILTRHLRKNCSQ